MKGLSLKSGGLKYLDIYTSRYFCFPINYKNQKKIKLRKKITKFEKDLMKDK